MVGRRNFTNGKGSDDKGSKYDQKQDLESGPRGNGKQRFRDVIGNVVADDRRKMMKQKLIDGVKEADVEKYRKSEDEVRSARPFGGRLSGN